MNNERWAFETQQKNILHIGESYSYIKCGILFTVYTFYFYCMQTDCSQTMMRRSQTTFAIYVSVSPFSMQCSTSNVILWLFWLRYKSQTSIGERCLDSMPLCMALCAFFISFILCVSISPGRNRWKIIENGICFMLPIVICTNYNRIDTKYG